MPVDPGQVDVDLVRAAASLWIGVGHTRRWQRQSFELDDGVGDRLRPRAKEVGGERRKLLEGPRLGFPAVGTLRDFRRAFFLGAILRRQSQQRQRRHHGERRPFLLACHSSLLLDSVEVSAPPFDPQAFSAARRQSSKDVFSRRETMGNSEILIGRGETGQEPVPCAALLCRSCSGPASDRPPSRHGFGVATGGVLESSSFDRPGRAASPMQTTIAERCAHPRSGPRSLPVAVIPSPGRWAARGCRAAQRAPTTVC